MPLHDKVEGLAREARSGILLAWSEIEGCRNAAPRKKREAGYRRERRLSEQWINVTCTDASIKGNYSKRVFGKGGLQKWSENSREPEPDVSDLRRQANPIGTPACKNVHYRGPAK
jgi:hypothetical protein